MASRAGARIINAEYVQFHPTALAVPGAEGFLISEAVRGEGGILLTPEGKPFMEKYAPEWKDLAPRDVVARAIHQEMTEHNYTYVLLDIASHMEADALRERFPNIYATCLKAGIDITREPIPVVPAAHYFCGGVQGGRVGTLRTLPICTRWARSRARDCTARTAWRPRRCWRDWCGGTAREHVGQIADLSRVAQSGLTEDRIARHMVERIANSLPAGSHPEHIPAWDESGLTEDRDPALIQGDMQTIQNIMWHYVGLVRSSDRLSRAIRELRHLQNEIETFYRTTHLSDGLIGLRNAVEAALIVAQAAQHNRRSRGCHYRVNSVAVGDRLI